MKTYLIDLDICGKDEQTITIENVDKIEKLSGYYSINVNGALITFEYPISKIQTEEELEEELDAILKNKTLIDGIDIVNSFDCVEGEE